VFRGNSSRVSRVVRLTLGIGLAAGSGFFLFDAATSSDAEASGPYSALTRTELTSIIDRGSVRNPVLLPEDLPPGAASDDDSGFYLTSNPITAEGRKHAGEVWLTVYVASALPPAIGNVSGYDVYQEWTGSPERHRPRCNPGDRPTGVLIRHVGDNKLSICLGPHPTDAARDYWSKVPFTADLAKVTWLRDG
jgi:hypothetical protein